MRARKGKAPAIYAILSTCPALGTYTFVALYPLLAMAAYWLFWRELQKGWGQ